MAVIAARTCWKRLQQLPVGAAGSKLVAYHIIGQCLLKVTPPTHRTAYEQDVVGKFISEWTRLGGFVLSVTGAKYCKLFAAAFDKPLLLKAIAADFTWTDLRRWSRKEVSVQERRNEVEERLKAKDQLTEKKRT